MTRRHDLAMIAKPQGTIHLSLVPRPLGEGQGTSGIRGGRRPRECRNLAAAMHVGVFEVVLLARLASHLKGRLPSIPDALDDIA